MSRTAKSPKQPALFSRLNSPTSLQPAQLITHLPRSPQKVFYFDFELTAAQFAAGYSAAGAAFPFSPDLIRVEMSPDKAEPEDYGFRNFRPYFATTVIDQIERHEARVVVIVNITYLSDHIQVTAKFNFVKRLKAFNGLAGYEFITTCRQIKKDHVKINPHRLNTALNTYSSGFFVRVGTCEGSE